jgi:4a-hydroxytetrahydrobiopterin dehydratase
MAAGSAGISKLDDDSIREKLVEIPDWSLVEGKLHRSFVFKDFSGAFEFMTQVALLAETRNHHPDWSNVYNRVVIDLNTHDVSGISVRDFDLAAAINQLLSK